MNSKKPAPTREQERSHAEEATERLFNETVRNLLNTPHKPHKAKDGERVIKPSKSAAKREDR
jgi:hypothetical protein